MKMVRKARGWRVFLMALLAGVWLAIPLCANAEVPAQTGLARIAVENTRLRKKPVDGDVIAVLPSGGCVYVYGQQEDAQGNTWYHVNAFHRERNKQGWIRGDLLVLPDTLFCDLVDFAIAEKHIIGLKSDGSVIAGGAMFYEPICVEGLYNAVNVDAGWYTSFVFFEDGAYWARGRAVAAQGEGHFENLATATVLDGTWAAIRKDGSYTTPDRYDADGNLLHEYDASHLKGVTQIEEGPNFMVCLTDDGRLHFFGWFAENYADAAEWTGIVKVSAMEHVVGLRADGTVVASGENLHGECDVSEWTDIVDIAAGEGFTVGIRSDGTAIATGSNVTGACNVGGFAEIVQIEADRYYCAGRTARGTLMFAGDIRFLDQSPLGVEIIMSSGE